MLRFASLTASGERLVLRISILVGALALVFAHGAAAQEPSFDCRQARTPTESVICADARLSELDRITTLAFSIGKRRGDSADFVAKAHALLSARDACKADKTCVQAKLVEALEYYQKQGISVAAPDWVLDPHAKPAPAESAPDSAEQASFDCRRARSPNEITICSDAHLRELDRITTLAFKTGKQREDSDDFVTEAQALLMARLACQADKRCILDNLVESLQFYQRSNIPVVVPVWLADRATGHEPAPDITPASLGAEPAAVPAAPLDIPPARPDALGGRRIALVIGNRLYKKAPLTNPTFDADQVSDSLKKIGFDVTEVKDADFATLDAAITDFVAKENAPDKPDIVLFYYAGHGFALSDGLRHRNYLMSTSSDLSSPSEAILRRDGMPLDEIINRISAPARITLAFVDACRNDPFHRGAGDRGFERVQVPLERQLYIGMSTQLGMTALDGEEGQGSPFAQAFVKIIATPGLRIDDAFRNLRDEVARQTGGRQKPEILQDDLTGGALVLVAGP